jgi:cytochrome P450
MVYEIIRDPILLAQVREEITPHVEAVRPKNEFGPGVWLAPCVKKLDTDALLNKCPLLKSCYIETLRMYSTSSDVKHLKEDVVLNDKDDGYKLPKGTYAHMPQDLHQFDPEYFSDPRDWQARRHMKETTNEKGQKTFTADMGTLEPYGEHWNFTSIPPLQVCVANSSHRWWGIFV